MQMPDVPFFRGQNRMDWLVATLLQTACDYGTNEQITAVGEIVGPTTVTRFGGTLTLYPPVTVVVAGTYVFLVSSSTKGAIQWVGNVLASSAVSSPSGNGTVSAYFGFVASAQLAAALPTVQANLGGRLLVLVGFSLGAASMTIVKDVLARQYGIDSSCIAIATPRPGTTTFANDYPTDNFSGFAVVNDVVPSVPPSTWTGLGLCNAWTPFPPFVTYTHVTAGNTLLLDGTLSPGYSLQSVTDVVLGINTGLWASYHNQPLYARLLRQQLPYVLGADYEGFAGSASLDNVAADVLSFALQTWPWATLQPSLVMGDSSMTVQLAIYIRDVNVPLGFQEVYYFPGSDPNTIFQAMSPGTSGNLSVLRQNFLSKSCQIYAYRASLVGPPRTSYLYKFAIPLTGKLEVTENIQDSLIYLGYNNNHTVKRQFHFRGVSNLWITGDQLTPQGLAGQATYIVGTGGWIPTLMSYSVGMLSYASTFTPFGAIQSGAQAAEGTPITLTFTPSNAIANNALIQIKGCRAAPLLNGRWQAIGTSPAGQVVLSGSQRYSCPASLNGSIALVNPTYYAMSEIAFNGVGIKKTGRPSFLQRGRQSVKLRHR
jgi:hypothetical protein